MKKNEVAKAINNVELFCNVIPNAISGHYKQSTCFACGKPIERDTECIRIVTRKEPGGSYLHKDCLKSRAIYQWAKSGNGAKEKLTKYNIDVAEQWHMDRKEREFVVTVTTKSPEVYCYCGIQGWYVGGEEKYVCVYKGVNHNAITRFLDSLFTSGYKFNAKVNGVNIYTTEDCRDVLNMKIRNAKVNKSLDKALNVNLK